MTVKELVEILEDIQDEINQKYHEMDEIRSRLQILDSMYESAANKLAEQVNN